MDYFEEFGFKKPKQQRTIKTIEDITNALELLSQSEDFAKLTTRDLSDRSGYALGTIFHHFDKFDNVFVYVFLARRRKALLNFEDIINQHPSDQPLSVLADSVLTCIIDELSKPPRKILLFLISKFLRSTKHPELINIEADLLIPAWTKASQRDKTNTIYNFSVNELGLRLRALQAITRSPFFEDNPIAGKAEHKAIAFTLFMQIFTII
jgi:AcrR family transcriptional regulator